jgi:hypothetical protein
MKTKLLLALAITLICLSSTYAAAFTPGNIVVTRVGPTIYSTGAKAYLDEYTTSGVLVQTIALPTDYIVPASLECGITSLSGDGQFLALSGMPTAVATTTASTASARKVLTVKYDGTIAAYTPTVTTPATTSNISAQTNSGANTFTLSAANGSIAVGQYVYGLGIPIGATVSAVSGTSLTLSANALANIASGQTLVFMTSDTPLYSNLRAPKGVFTTDGSNFWLGGDDRYIQYYNPNENGGVPVNIVADYARFLTSVDGILFKSVRYGTEIAAIGTSTNPFPTTAATAVNASKINNSDDAFQIIAVDVDATVDGQDVMYVAENNGLGTLYGIKKYSKVGTTWTYNGGFGTLAEGYSGITAKVTAQGIVTIYTINRPTVSGYHGGRLTKYVDNAGYNVAPNLTETTVLQSFDQATSPKGGSWRSVNFVPANLPGVPTSVIATAGNGQASVSFSTPVTNGGSVITLYTVTSNPAGITATGTSSPIVVAGLTNETAYTFTVTAANTNGTGESSIASNTVTPSITSSLIDSKSQQISIIPNPVADILNIHFTALKQSETVKIYSMNGKLLSTKEVSAGSSEVMFNVVNLQNGLYIVKLADAIRKFNKK